MKDWTLYIDIVDKGKKKYLEEEYKNISSQEDCEKKFREIEGGLPSQQYVAQAYVLGPEKVGREREKVVFKKFPDDIYTVNEDLI